MRSNVLSREYPVTPMNRPPLPKRPPPKPFVEKQYYQSPVQSKVSHRFANTQHISAPPYSDIYHQATSPYHNGNRQQSQGPPALN